MFHHGATIFYFDVRECIGATLVPHQHRIALGIVARAMSRRQNLHQSPVAVDRIARRNALRDNCAARVATDVHHLRTGIGLHFIVRQRDRKKCADRVFALKNAARILPRNGGTSFDLGPRNFTVAAHAFAPLGNEVVNAAAPLGIPSVPILKPWSSEFRHRQGR